MINKSDKTLYLHIGTHKTGTTSIQHFLVDQMSTLQNAGLAVFLGKRPKRNGKTEFLANAWLLADQFIRSDLLTVMRLKHVEQRGFIPEKPMEKDRLRKLVCDSKCSEFLVSAESFSFLRTPAELKHLTTYLEKLGCKIVVILFSRNVHDWKASNSSQLVKMQYHGPYVEPLPENKRVDADWYYNHKAICNFWQQVGELKVIDYDMALSNDGSVITSFMKAIGKENITSNKSYFLNQSITK